jgi:hypothetical protein
MGRPDALLVVRTHHASTSHVRIICFLPSVEIIQVLPV